ncbi:hypothetical protein [Rubrivirga sp. IMCC45206]|uniref:hypothetical protein n=1 Tax=Rubrivirga sp. IMCC45206 TaxID=3391614 RepID=UPI00398FCB32
MRALVLFVLLAASARAQGPAPASHPHDPARRATVWEGAGMYAAGTVAGVASFAGSFVLVDAISPPGDDTGVLLIPAGVLFGVSATTYGMGRLLGIDGTARGAAFGAAVGAIPGTALLALSLTISDLNALGPAIAGAYLTLALVPLGAVVGYGMGARRVHLAPVALAAPTGERGAGLSFTVAL